jgi:serine O-acetyltransferase
MISAGAKIIGSFKIGENSKIGAGSVVIEEVPPNCTVVGVPGRIVKRNNKALVREELNQVDLPDPVSEDIKSLEHANSEIINQLIELEQQVRVLKRELDKMEE